ncbi:hypothetical protein ACFSM5_10115 [Lacibacterium aquatile]|uniref:Uncharacterized protein n=1 Tax=Lacibacterium aquatile TaxID=1168082 RepID=A0ABW5DQ46_9PROT
MWLARTAALGLCWFALSAGDARQCDLDYIGTMTMDSDGSIHALLNICDPQAGAVGHRYLSFWKGEADYASLLARVGGMRPGDSKPIPASKEKPTL